MVSTAHQLHSRWHAWQNCHAPVSPTGAAPKTLEKRCRQGCRSARIGAIQFSSYCHRFPLITLLEPRDRAANLGAKSGGRKRLETPSILSGSWIHAACSATVSSEETEFEPSVAVWDFGFQDRFGFDATTDALQSSATISQASCPYGCRALRASFFGSGKAIFTTESTLEKRVARVTMHCYSGVAISRINVSIGPDDGWPFLVFGFAVLTTIVNPAAVNARLS